MGSIQAKDSVSRKVSVSENETDTMLVIGRLLELERNINAKTQGRIRELEVESTGDTVILRGVTSTYYAKQLATQTVQEELGVFTLDNQIEVI